MDPSTAPFSKIGALRRSGRLPDVEGRWFFAALVLGILVTALGWSHLRDRERDLERAYHEAAADRLQHQLNERLGKVDFILRGVTGLFSVQAMVERLSGGKLGYVHVRGMDDDSFREVVAEALGRHSAKEALVVDTRFNGGGNLHDELATLLSGRRYLQFVPRARYAAQPLQARARLGVLSDARGLYPRLTARENIVYYGRLQGMTAAAANDRANAGAHLCIGGIGRTCTQAQGGGEGGGKNKRTGQHGVDLSASVHHGPPLKNSEGAGAFTLAESASLCCRTCGSARVGQERHYRRGGRGWSRAKAALSRLQAQRDQQRGILHRRKGAQRPGLQVHEVTGVHALGAVAVQELDFPFNALHRGFAARHVLGQAFAGEQHDAHDFELARLQDGGAAGLCQCGAQGAHADDLAGLCVGLCHGVSPCCRALYAVPAMAL